MSHMAYRQAYKLNSLESISLTDLSESLWRGGTHRALFLSPSCWRNPQFMYQIKIYNGTLYRIVNPECPLPDGLVVECLICIKRGLTSDDLAPTKEHSWTWSAPVKTS